MGKYGPGRFECTAPVPARGKGKFMFRAQQPGEIDAEYEDLKKSAQERWNRIEGRKAGLKNAKKSGPAMVDDLTAEQPENK